eukprot:TRINITY_DN2957_c0_g1_i1.p1 TRINITY_DN2957_c0_g1~~TRINITY_DN2957_c0_g1_i1.p1  ORF type:complete len:487 (+),score=72.40 TRINITY_DN2957_c0_g1_i1:103-1563(+)
MKSASRRTASPAPKAAAQSADASDKSPSEPPDQTPTSQWLLARNIHCYLLMGTRVFQQAMRNAIAPLMVFISEDLGIGVGQAGVLLSATAAGYFFTQVPGGQLAEKFGSKIVITSAMGLSAVCCILAPVSADLFGVSGLWFMMAILGAVQGPLFPASFVSLSKWMPKASPGMKDEKAWGTSMLDIGISIGSLLVIPVATGVAGSAGWRMALYIIGFASMVFIAMWHFLASEEPSSCSYISADELQFLEANCPKPKKASDDDVKAGDKKQGFLGLPTHLAFKSGMWAVFVCHMAFNFGAYYLTNWSPTYYSQVLKVSNEHAKYHLMMPHVTNLATKSLNPILIKWVDTLGISVLRNRQLFTVFGFLMAAVVLLPVHQLRGLNPWVSTVLFSACNAFFGLSPSGFKANYLDITEKYVGSISGIGNALATVSSWVGPQFVAFLLSRYQSWDLVLASVALSNIVASVVYLKCATVVPIERDVKPDEKKEQ